jgi:hypothetical protein
VPLERKKRKRSNLRKAGKLVDSAQVDLWQFTTDVSFNSPSEAANIVSASSINGRQAWKVTTPNSQELGFSVHPATYRPPSPKAVPPPFAVGVTWEHVPMSDFSFVGTSHRP